MLGDTTTKVLSVIAFALFSIGIGYLNFRIEQNEFNVILCSYLVAMIGYGLLVFMILKRKFDLKLGIACGVVMRLVLLFAFPQLSDDIYRFLWDGHLIHSGMSPLEMLPSDLIEDSTHSDGYLMNIYGNLNSQSYFTVYPPLSQMIFYVSTISSDWSPEFSAIIMKLLLLIGDALSLIALIRILQNLAKPASWSLIYFLNPLLITETAGQLHFEGLMVMFLALALLMIIKEKYVYSGVLLAGSVGVKLLPLMFIPLILRFVWPKGWLRFSSGFILTTALIFVPFFIGLDLPHFLNSLNLYFQTFEFNASVYFILRKLGFWISGYNQIALLGPLLGLGTLGYILYLTFVCPSMKNGRELEGLFTACFCAFACYLFFATTVHPWYLIMLLFFATLLGRIWVLIWSGVVILSYSTYAHPDFMQNYSLISLEYGIVFLSILLGLGFPLSKKKKA